MSLLQHDFLDFSTFVCKNSVSGDILGAFYIKPNFHGRSSHICNTGFIVNKSARGIGVGSFMMRPFLQIARDIGYLAVMNNLVYVTNSASVNLWRKFDFTEIGRIPNAGDLKGYGHVDAIIFHYDLRKIALTECIVNSKE